jgi:glutathione synthase/RimK-type ligase-like ATP-grasp enzyme
VKTIVVVSRVDDWLFEVPKVEIVSARRYLAEESYARMRHARVYNLCRSYRYKSVGYYVSLLAEARGHRPLPSVDTIQGLKSVSLARFYSDELEDTIQRNLAPLQSDAFTLSIYFGRNLAGRYERLSQQLFSLFPAPFLRAEFERKGDWELVRLAPIATSEIPDTHHAFVVEAATRHFSRPRPRRRLADARYDLAILHDPDEELAPSDEVALRKFVRVGRRLGLDVDLVTRDDFGSLPEFDALLIRETTDVANHTFRFAQRAEAEGMVVIDDPSSILRCGNKVYLAELLARRQIAAPKTLVLHRDNVDRVEPELGFPCVVKQPDSAFSLGVKKVADRDELEATLDEMLDDSELVIAQEFLPTEFDWRVGVLAGRPLWACKYFMAGSHWQIARHGGGKTRFGAVEAVPLTEVPSRVLRAGVRAANAIGDGLYGVDVKEVDGHAYVVEVNDNPNLESGVEDKIGGDEIYEAILRHFLERIESRGKEED